MDKRIQWLVVSIAHALLVFVLAVAAFRVPVKFGLLIAVAVYAGMWYLHPLRFYRRTFATMLSIWTTFFVVSSLDLKFKSTLLNGLTELAVKVSNSPLIHICWTVIMLALLILDFLSRLPDRSEQKRTRGVERAPSPSFAQRFKLSPRVRLALLLGLVFALLLFGPV